MHKNYAKLIDNTDKKSTTEITYLSRNFQIGLLNYETSYDDAGYLYIENLQLLAHSRMQLLELANVMEAYLLGYSSTGECFEYLDCIIIQCVDVDNSPALKLEVSYVEEVGKKVLQKDVFLSRSECHSLAKNIDTTIRESYDRGRNLIISA